jgi:hypothetical protein
MGRAAEQAGQLVLQINHREQAAPSAWGELDQHIDIAAAGFEILTQHRPEQLQPPHAVPTTYLGDGIVRDV